MIPFFFFRLKNYISQMFTVIVNTLMKTFSKVVHYSMDPFM